jgi:NDP-sugar pyrophosphorylase family protein
MQPLSDVLPKPALPLPDGPVIQSPIRLAVNSGARRVVVNTWHLADHMVTAVSDLENPGAEIVLSPEKELMGGAGALARARDRGLLEGDDAVLVLNGDCVLELQLENLIAHHVRSDDLVTIALLAHPEPRRWSRVLLDATNHVDHILPPGLSENNQTPFLFPGAMIVSRAALESLPNRPGDTNELLWAPARKVHRLGGVEVSGRWREVGTPVDYLDAVIHDLAGTNVIDASAKVSSGADLTRVYVGRQVAIGSGAVIQESVVADGATVRAGAVITRSVLLGDVEAKDGEVLNHEIRALAR